MLLFSRGFKIYFLALPKTFGREIGENPFQLSYTDVYISEEIPLCMKEPKESLSYKKVKKTEKRPLLSAQLHYRYKIIMSCYNSVLHSVDRDSTENLERDARICTEC